MLELKHNWSGWPGAWCLDCGLEDPHEIALANGDLEIVEGESFWVKWKSEEAMAKYDLSPCSEPGSNRFNPYIK